MTLSKEEVLHIAKLARLSLSEFDIEKFRGQLSSILEYVQKLEEVNTTGITAEVMATDTGALRKDVVESTDPSTRDAMLEQAPVRQGEVIETLGVFE